MDEEEKKPADDVNDLEEELRNALFDALSPEDVALIVEARAARDRRGKKKPKIPRGKNP